MIALCLEWYQNLLNTFIILLFLNSFSGKLTMNQLLRNGFLKPGYKCLSNSILRFWYQKRWNLPPLRARTISSLIRIIVSFLAKILERNQDFTHGFAWEDLTFWSAWGKNGFWGGIWSFLFYLGDSDFGSKMEAVWRVSARTKSKMFLGIATKMGCFKIWGYF